VYTTLLQKILKNVKKCETDQKADSKEPVCKVKCVFLSKVYMNGSAYKRRLANKL